MRSVGVLEAKKYFSQILLEVEKGKKYVITKYGNEVAMLIPVAKPKLKENEVLDAIQSIRRLRKGVTLGKNLAVKMLRKEGQK